MQIASHSAAHYVDPTVLKLIFGAGLLLLGGFLVHYEAPENCEPGEFEGEVLEENNTGRGTTTIESADGETFTYDTVSVNVGFGG